MASAKAAYTMRVFKCQVCGGVMLAAKKSNKRTPKGHEKQMFCPYCNDERTFVQIGEA